MASLYVKEANEVERLGKLGWHGGTRIQRGIRVNCTQSSETASRLQFYTWLRAGFKSSASHHSQRRWNLLYEFHLRYTDRSFLRRLWLRCKLHFLSNPLLWDCLLPSALSPCLRFLHVRRSELSALEGPFLWSCTSDHNATKRRRGSVRCTFAPHSRRSLHSHSLTLSAPWYHFQPLSYLCFSLCFLT
jgi:hypothetical protein